MMCKMKSLRIFLVFFGYFVRLHSIEATINSIALEDILSEEYMPTTLLMLENLSDTDKMFNDTNDIGSQKKTFDGTLNRAMTTMDFHRSMMNQYLCRSFLAEQIVVNMSTTRVKRRMGHVTPGIGEPTKSHVDITKNLIYDEGSSGYKDWLSKSSTLEDIYRHYDKAQNKVDVIEEIDEGNNEDFEEGYNVEDLGKKQETKSALNHRHEETYFSGGGYPGPPYTNYGPSGHQSFGPVNQHNYGPPLNYHHTGGDEGYPPLLPEHHVTYEQQYEYHEPEYHHSPPTKYHVYNYYTKDKDLADLFEIALTALAFLAFKMFIVHVIMCINSVTNNSTTTLAMAMSMSPTATGTGTTEMPSIGGDMSSTGGDMPSAGNDMPSTGNDMSDTGGDMPSTGGDMPSTGGDMSDTGGDMPSTGGDMSDTGGDMPSTGGDMSDTGGDMPSTGGDMSDAGGDMPSIDGDMPSTGGDMTDTGGDMPDAGDDMPITDGEMPSTGGDTPSNGGDMPSTGGDMPSTGDDMPSTGGDMPSTGGDMPSTGGDMPSMGGDGDMSDAGGEIPSTGGDIPGTGDEMSITGGEMPNTEDGMPSTSTGGGITSTGGLTSTGGGTTGDGSTGSDGTEGTGTGTGSGVDVNSAMDGTDDGDDVRDSLHFRFKRSQKSKYSRSRFPNPRNDVINELSRKILVAIESSLVADRDDGVCLRKTLCETNKWSRTLEGRHKLFIPLWSLGMSWLSGRIVRNVAPSTSMIDALKASILGLGKANCGIIYQKCNLEREVMERKRRKRRKRETHNNKGT